MKTCAKCKKVKPLSGFPKHKGHKDGLGYDCKKCNARRMKTWYRQNKPTAPARRLEYRSSNRGRLVLVLIGARNKAKSRGYAAPTITVDELLQTEQHRCQICHRGKHIVGKLCLDHDHKTGEFRGWLCDLCNRGLGYFYDNPSHLRRAAAYLSRRKSR